jgi:fibronectin type 3 domain-containing protein
MKKIIIVLIAMFLMVPCVVHADTSVTLEWSANSEPDLAGYRVYEDSIKVADVPCMGNDKACCTWTSGNLADPHEYYVTAYDNDGFESDPSNTVDTYPPNMPQNLNISINVTINP